MSGGAPGRHPDAEVYSEMRDRVATLGSTPRAMALDEALDLLGKAGRGLRGAPEPPGREPVPDWLARALVGKGVAEHEVRAMAPEAAFERWNRIISAPQAER